MFPPSMGDTRAAAHDSRVVKRGNDDDTARDLGRIERAREIPQSELAFVLVAVIAGGKQHCRPTAVLDDTDRQAHRSPTRVVSRVGNNQDDRGSCRLISKSMLAWIFDSWVAIDVLLSDDDKITGCGGEWFTSRIRDQTHYR